MMEDLLYFFIAPMTVAVLVLLYKMKVAEREWVSLTKEEIYHLWDTNSEKFGGVEDFGRALERAIQEKNP
jgi:hypothetical protein